MNVCRQCGLAANTLTCLVKYGNLPKKNNFSLSTFHHGECGCCGRLDSVTEARDFFYPDFSLLSVKFKNRIKLREDE